MNNKYFNSITSLTTCIAACFMGCRAEVEESFKPMLHLSDIQELQLMESLIYAHRLNEKKRIHQLLSAPDAALTDVAVEKELIDYRFEPLFVGIYGEDPGFDVSAFSIESSAVYPLSQFTGDREATLEVVNVIKQAESSYLVTVRNDRGGGYILAEYLVEFNSAGVCSVINFQPKLVVDR